MSKAIVKDGANGGVIIRGKEAKKQFDISEGKLRDINIKKAVKDCFYNLITRNVNGFPTLINYEVSIKERKLIIKTERMESDLFDLLLRVNKLSLHNILFILIELAKSIHILHSNDLFHCDIRPENILVNYAYNNGEVMIFDVALCDFDAMKYTKGEDLQSYINEAFGSDSIRPPEVLNKDKYNKSVDIWAFGMLIYVLMNRYYFVDWIKKVDPAKSTFRVFSDQNILEEYLYKSLSRRKLYKHPLYDLMRRCLKINKEKRPNIKEIFSEMSKFTKKQLVAPDIKLEVNLNYKLTKDHLEKNNLSTKDFPMTFFYIRMMLFGDNLEGNPIFEYNRLIENISNILEYVNNRSVDK